MKSSIYLLKIFTLLFLLVSVQIANAQISTNGTLVASVNLEKISIEQKTDGKVVINFDLTNGKGLQTGVRYGATLRTKDNKFIVDEKTYPDTLTLPENSGVSKQIIYTPPETLSGTYNIFITSSNDKNFLLANSFVKEISITAQRDGLYIEPGSCNSYGKSIETAIAPKGDVPVLISCIVTNNSSLSITATTSSETRVVDGYGQVVKQNEDNTNPITFGPKEKKVVNFSVPVEKSPKVYSVSIRLSSPLGNSNPIFVRYIVSGMITNIRNASLDKDAYKKGDGAVASVIWNITDPTVSEVTLETSIKNKSGNQCAETNTQTFKLGYIRPVITEIPFTISKRCYDPVISVALKDKKGEILDKSDFKIKTTSTSIISKRTSIIIILALLLACGLAVYIRFKKRHLIEQKPTITPPSSSGTMLVIFGIVALLGMLLPSSSAYAYSYTSGINNDVNTTVSGIPSTTFQPGTTVVTSVTISSPSTHTVSLSASNNGATSVIVSSGIVSSGNPIFQTYTFQVPSTAGNSYSVFYETGVDEPQIVYARVSSTPVSSNSSQTGPFTCGDPRSPVYFSRTDETYEVRFFSDPAGTSPINTTGMGLNINWLHSSYGWYYGPYTNNGGSAISGFMYQYTNSIYGSFTDQYGNSSCDTEENHDETSISGGTGYVLIP